MDIFTLIKSKTRQKIFQLFLKNDQQAYYLRDLERRLKISAGNLRRELLALIKIGLFISEKKGRLVYYRIIQDSPVYKIIYELLTEKKMDIINQGYSWTTSIKSRDLSSDKYCPTRDIFSARLETILSKLKNIPANDSYLLIAIAGEIGNNSFDHNLGNWTDISGVFFSWDYQKKIIVLADRGQGVLATIKRAKPNTKDDNEALNVAFTQIISGRTPEQRGNGLKFVNKIIKENNWSLRFESGNASLEIKDKIMQIKKARQKTRGCFAVVKY